MLFSGAKVQLFRGKQNFSQLFHYFLSPLAADAKIGNDVFIYYTLLRPSATSSNVRGGVFLIFLKFLKFPNLFSLNLIIKGL